MRFMLLAVMIFTSVLPATAHAELQLTAPQLRLKEKHNRAAGTILLTLGSAVHLGGLIVVGSGLADLGKSVEPSSSVVGYVAIGSIFVGLGAAIAGAVLLRRAARQGDRAKRLEPWIIPTIGAGFGGFTMVGGF